MCLAWLKFDPKTCDKIYLIKPVGGIAVFLSSEFLVAARQPVPHLRSGTGSEQATAFARWVERVLLYRRRSELPQGFLYRMPILLYDTTATIFMIMSVTVT
ncbi:hypothetical protein BT69DRAFT_1336809 [Atractiella rhizophila]|nr:hypothetical protein BT69DRAFT_1336809 [Atractiella rhizophila]